MDKLYTSMKYPAAGAINLPEHDISYCVAGAAMEGAAKCLKEKWDGFVVLEILPTGEENDHVIGRIGGVVAKFRREM